jgi:hypothetical protein
MPGSGAITLRSEEGVRGATDADMAVISQVQFREHPVWVPFQMLLRHRVRICNWRAFRCTDRWPVRKCHRFYVEHS